MVPFWIQAVCATYALLPHTLTVPETFSISPIMQDSSDDLPDPTIPTTATSSPFLTSTLIPFSTVSSTGVAFTSFPSSPLSLTLASSSPSPYSLSFPLMSHAKSPLHTLTTTSPVPMPVSSTCSTAESSSSASSKYLSSLPRDTVACVTAAIASGKLCIGPSSIRKNAVAVNTLPASSWTPVSTQVPNTSTVMVSGPLQSTMVLAHMKYMDLASHASSSSRSLRILAPNVSSHACSLITRM
uniref:Uncharacterized protein n=1 Tax=Arundo donax TaxID=35708 RepID=A0A0A9AT53_ARUDO